MARGYRQQRRAILIRNRKVYYYHQAATNNKNAADATNESSNQPLLVEQKMSKLWNLEKDETWFCQDIQTYLQNRVYFWDEYSPSESFENMPLTKYGDFNEIVDFVSKYYHTMERYEVGPSCSFTIHYDYQRTSLLLFPNKRTRVVTMCLDLGTSTHTGHILGDGINIEAVNGSINDVLEILVAAKIPRLSFTNDSFKKFLKNQQQQGQLQQDEKQLSIYSIFSKYLPQFEELNFCMNLTTTDVIDMIAHVVSVSKELKSLYIHDKRLKDLPTEMLKQLEMAFSTNQSIPKLSLSSNDLSDAVMGQLVSSLYNTRKLQKLNLSNNLCGSHTLTAIANNIHNKSTSSTLKSIDLSKCSEGSIIDLSILANSIITNDSLKYLYLHDNQNGVITGGFETLSKALTVNSTLQQVRLEQRNDTFWRDGDNNIMSCASPIELGKLFRHFGQWIGLDHLNISNNQLSIEGLSYLAAGIAENSTLSILKARDLKLDDNKETKLAWIQFMTSLRNNSKLHTLDIEGNTLDTDAVTALAQSLTMTTSLANLSLDRCGLTNESITSFATQLPNMYGLKELFVSFNLFDGKEGSKALADGIKNNSTLTKILFFDGDGPCWAVIGRISRSVGKYRRDFPIVLLHSRFNLYRQQIIQSCSCIHSEQNNDDDDRNNNNNNVTSQLSSFPIALWPFVLQKSKSGNDLSIQHNHYDLSPSYWKSDSLGEPDVWIENFKSPYHCTSLMYLLLREEILPTLFC